MPKDGEGGNPFSGVPWFTEEELHRFSEFLTGDSARDQRSFQTLLSTVTEVLGETSFDKLLHKLVDHAIQTTRSERGILLLEDASGELKVRISRDKQGRDLGPTPPLARTVCEMVRKEGKPVYERVSGDSEVLDLSHSVATMRLRQVMCAALRARGRTIGVIYIDSTLSGPPHTAADLMLFHAQAGLIGMAIENHRLLRETMEAQALDQELQTARHIQAKLLPETPAVFGETELAGLSEPSHSVGGDYFDYFPLDLDRVGITVGDVSGHGVGPALIMSSVRANVRSLLLTRRTLGGIYGLLNRALYADLTDGRFVSLFICLYDAKRHTLEYQNAGHTAPLIFSTEHETFQEIPTTAPALGIIDDISAGPCPTIPAKKGDFLISYTDGVTEMHSPDGELFGEERIKSAVRRSVLAGGGPSDIVAAVKTDLESHSAGLPRRDDVTLVAVRL
ncbi:MAG: PP2C family protein-serine/threonine phosphatase [Planctomycetota bacterium]|jgi:serine phosphatase RsbU (regulator of sigma subunit)